MYKTLITNHNLDEKNKKIQVEKRFPLLYNVKMEKDKHELNKALLYIDHNLIMTPEINQNIHTVGLKHKAEDFLRSQVEYYVENQSEAYVSSIAIEKALELRDYEMKRINKSSFIFTSCEYKINV